MNLLLIISLAVLVLCAVIAVLQIHLFLRLKRKLNKANYDTYAGLLGKHAQFRRIDAKTKRYRWSRGMFTIKSTFDNEGNAVGDVRITRRKVRLFKRTGAGI